MERKQHVYGNVPTIEGSLSEQSYEHGETESSNTQPILTGLTLHCIPKVNPEYRQRNQQLENCSVGSPLGDHFQEDQLRLIIKRNVDHGSSKRETTPGTTIYSVAYPVLGLSN